MESNSTITVTTDLAAEYFENHDKQKNNNKTVFLFCLSVLCFAICHSAYEILTEMFYGILFLVGWIFILLYNANDTFWLISKTAASIGWLYCIVLGITFLLVAIKSNRRHTLETSDIVWDKGYLMFVKQKKEQEKWHVLTSITYAAWARNGFRIKGRIDDKQKIDFVVATKFYTNSDRLENILVNAAGAHLHDCAN